MISFTAKSILQTHDLYEYVLNTSVYPRESQFLKDLRDITSNHPRALMGTAPDVGQLIALLLNLIQPLNTIEIGVFTGYSLLLTALNIPHHGKITAIDVDRSAYYLGLPIIQKAGVDHKITFIESQALPVLDDLLKDAKNKASFDFAFVDADKMNNPNYHERLVELVKPGGIIVYDNTLWRGTVAKPEDKAPNPDTFEQTRKVVSMFNQFLANDSRLQISQVTVGDGITICRCL